MLQGQRNDFHRSDYEDLGLVIDATNVATGATVYTQPINGLEWVRNIIFHSCGDQIYSIYVSRYHAGMVDNYAYSIVSNVAVSTVDAYRPNSIVGANALLGTGARIGINNSSGATMTFAKLKVQLMGL